MRESQRLIMAQILSRFMKKGKEEYATASDGLEAFEKYRQAPESFKVIFMGMTSDGKIISSTTHII
jgi:hypothetical protein